MKKSMWLMWGVVLAVGLYAGGTLLWRAYARRAAEERFRLQQMEKADKDVELNGGYDLKIVKFLAVPAPLHPGETAMLCYGVVNAASVSLDPPAGEVWPSMHRCIEIRPRRSTTCTLRARDAAGHEKTATLEVPVR